MFMLSLHHLTALDAKASELVRIASAMGCRNVSLFTYMPAAHRGRYPMVEVGEAESLAELMVQSGVACHSLEVFPLIADPDWSGMSEGLDIGRTLGARFATVHSHLENHYEAAGQFARLAAMAAERGISLALEFNPFSQCDSLARALALLEQAECIGAPAGIVLDTLHAARSGTDINEIASAAGMVSYVQLSDGPRAVERDERWKEAIGHRLYPAEGELPLAEMLGVLPPDLPLDVEVPRRSGVSASASPEDRCRAALEATRRFLDGAGFGYTG
jgi:sugar phosphate isomerase/epimerase